MKNIAIGIVALLLIGTIIFAIAKSGEARKHEERARFITQEMQEMELKAERMKTLAEMEAVKSVDAQAQAMVLSEALKNCQGK